MMTLRFSRPVIFCIGIVLMCLIYFAIQYHTYKKSLFTHGVVVYQFPLQFSIDGLATMALYYYVDMHEYEVLIDLPVEKANQEVVVRYLPDAPDKGTIYTPVDFWFINMFWLLLPLIIWIAFIFTFMTPAGKIELRIVSKT